MYCVDCGHPSVGTATYCEMCGSLLHRQPVNPPRHDHTMGHRGTDPRQSDALRVDHAQSATADDVASGDEQMHWVGRPSRFWSPLSSFTTRYRLTSQRLVVERGLIGRRTESFGLFGINDIEIRQGIFARLAGIGDVFLYSSDREFPSTVLHNVDDPRRVKDLVHEAARKERNRRRYFPGRGL